MRSCHNTYLKYSEIISNYVPKIAKQHMVNHSIAQCGHQSSLTGEVYQAEGKVNHEERQDHSWLERWLVLGGWHSESVEMEQAPWFETVCCWTCISLIIFTKNIDQRMCHYSFFLNLEHVNKHCRKKVFYLTDSKWTTTQNHISKEEDWGCHQSLHGRRKALGEEKYLNSHLK